MKQSELHEFIKENEPNICQIVVRKTGKKSIPTNGTVTSVTTAFTSCRSRKA